MRNEQLKKTIKEMTLNELDNYVWNEYEKEKEPIEVVLTRPFENYEIHQKQFDECSGWTDVSIDNVHIKINWQALGANIEVDCITPRVLYFLKKEIFNAPKYIEGYYFCGDDELDDFLKYSTTSSISLEEFMEEHPEYKKLYEDMRCRYLTGHTSKMWEKLAKNTEKRLSKPETESNINIEYYLKFKSISEEAAALFNEYLGKMHSTSKVNAVTDKDMQDYIIETIRNTLNDFVGVSYNVDREAFVEICKLKKDDIEMNRLNIFKDVKSKVVKHFEDIGFTLSDRNLSSIDWWINNYKIKY